MNNWIDEEGQKTHLEKEARDNKDRLIAIANFWGLLRTQLYEDVEQINSNIGFREVFKEPIEVEPTDRGGYMIKKTLFPAAFYIQVENGGDRVIVSTEYRLDDEADWDNKQEVLMVKWDGRHILVTSHTESFIVPKQASKYILQTVVRAKDDSVKFFATHKRFLTKSAE
jgi:hypothetical protein